MFFMRKKYIFWKRKLFFFMFLYIWHFRCFKCIIKNRENLKGSLLISDCQTSVRVSKLNRELLMRKIAECLNYLHLHLHVWQICIVGCFAASAPEGSRLSSSPRRGEVVCSQDHTKKHTRHRHTGGQPANHRTWWTAGCANKQWWK